jgi:hypothetical protein
VTGRRDGEDAGSPGSEVEGEEVMRPPVVSHVEDALVGRKRDPVRLVQGVREDREVVGGRVEAVDGVRGARLRPEALEVAVARIGEPDAPVAGDDDVVRGVEPLDERLGLSRRSVDAADSRGLGERSLLAHDEVPGAVERHPVRHVGVLAEDRDTAIGEGHPLDRDGLPANGREVERVLVSDVDRALVGIDGDDALESGNLDRRGLEAGCLLHGSPVSARPSPLQEARAVGSRPT